jgi:hypothetical protein
MLKKYAPHNEQFLLLTRAFSAVQHNNTGVAKYGPNSQPFTRLILFLKKVLFYKPWTALSTPSAPILVTAGYQNQTNFTR